MKYICYLCKGSGWLEIIDFRYRNRFEANNKNEAMTVHDAICPLCDGKGYLNMPNVPPERLSQE